MIIYATLGCGKTTLVKEYPNKFIDVDTILNSIAKEYGIFVDDEQKTGYILLTKFKSGLLPQYWDIIKEASFKATEQGRDFDVLGANFFLFDISDIMYVYPDNIKVERFCKIFKERGKAPLFRNILESEAYWKRRKPFEYIEENKYLSDYLK
jgi:hypothetical protein